MDANREEDLGLIQVDELDNWLKDKEWYIGYMVNQVVVRLH